jgi:hypothetical protein
MSMTTPRAVHTATLLNTGEALVAGGIVGYRFVIYAYGDFCEPTGTTKADLFDSATGTFAATGPMTAPRFGHTATVLQDSKVLVAGGSTVSPPTAEIFDPPRRSSRLQVTCSRRGGITPQLCWPAGKFCRRWSRWRGECRIVRSHTGGFCGDRLNDGHPILSHSDAASVWQGPSGRGSGRIWRNFHGGALRSGCRDL